MYYRGNAPCRGKKGHKYKSQEGGLMKIGEIFYFRIGMQKATSTSRRP